MAVPRFNDLTNPFQRARSMTGLSQYALADALGIQQSVISRYESCAMFPDPATAKKFVLWCRKRKIRMSLEEIYERVAA
mgnify:FL=1